MDSQRRREHASPAQNSGRKLACAPVKSGPYRALTQGAAAILGQLPRLRARLGRVVSGYAADVESSRRGSRRPVSVVVASIGTVLMALLLIALGAGSLTSGHGGFSGAVGMFLGAYGLLIAAAGWGLWRGSMLARGPVLATGVINLIVAISMAGSAPEAWPIAAVAGVTVLATALPATSRWLHWPRTRMPLTPGGAPPATDDPRK